MFNLITQLHFKHIYFRGQCYDQPTIEVAIRNLAEYIVKNNRSTSPFVLFTAYNHVKTIIAYYAILQAGKIAVVLDPETKQIELNEIIVDLDPAAILFMNAQTVSFLYSEEIVFRIPNKNFIISSDLTDICTIAFTNAEDGYNKGAMLSEKNLVTETFALMRANSVDANSVTCALLHYSHLFGLVQGILVPTHAGCSILIIELNLLKLPEILKVIEQHHVSHIYSVPSVYYILGKVDNIEQVCQNVKEFCSGGVQLSSHVFEGFFKKTKRKIREGYGLTECSPAVAYNYQEEDPIMTSFGKPLPICELKIVDEFGNECKNYEKGEICIKGDNVFKGYFNQEETTNKVLKDGWLYTGDYGRKDENGFFYFCGLKKEMINVAGNNVYPKKIERLFSLHSNVISVQVFCEESLLQGHNVGVRVQLKDNSKIKQEDFKNWCVTNINNTILPKIWHFE